ncbi:alpha/beta fold hydrolase [Candidatus Woesearchaeota archaeon]|nr:alpha/beta fold hydrolase [Candidatus Woesearchaeota archaeon]
MKRINQLIIIALLIFLIVWVVVKKQEQSVIVINNTDGKNFSSAYPIILVHGWMGKAVDFSDYALTLQEEGVAAYKGAIDSASDNSICPEKWPSSISVSAEYYTEKNKNQGIEDYAKELEPIIDLTLQCTDSDQVILLAHSMGGLVSRQYIAEAGGGHVKKLITLATPHYGFNDFTRSEIILMLLDIFTGRTLEVEQMMPDSDFIKSLDKEDISYRNKMVSIGTYNLDNETLLFDLPVLTEDMREQQKKLFSNTDIIVPLDSTKLSGAKYYQVKGCTHTQIINFKSAPGKGPINDAKACPEAYQLVKDEIAQLSNRIIITYSVSPGES